MIVEREEAIEIVICRVGGGKSSGGARATREGHSPRESVVKSQEGFQRQATVRS